MSRVKRALAALSCVAFLTLVFEVVGEDAQPVPAVIVGATFALLVVAGFWWVDRQAGGRKRAFAAVYVGAALLLGFVMFSLAGAGVGATLLLMVLVSQSVLLLPLPAAVVVAAAVPLVHVGMEWSAGLRNGLGTLAAALFTAVVTELLQREQRARGELAAAHERLRGYAEQAEQLATTQERNRLARDIHDGLGHHLTVVQMQIKAARAVLASDPARADSVLAKAQDQSTEALAEVRRSVAALREPRAAQPLEATLKSLAAETRAAGVPTDLQVAGLVRTLPSEVEDSLFRAAQEGLTNVRKHAAAGHAELFLDYRDHRAVRLEIRDDGTGLVPVEPAGFGLLGLRERAAALGGSVVTESAPGRGTTLRLEVPG